MRKTAWSHLGRFLKEREVLANSRHGDLHPRLLFVAPGNEHVEVGTHLGQEILNNIEFTEKKMYFDKQSPCPAVRINEQGEIYKTITFIWSASASTHADSNGVLP